MSATKLKLVFTLSIVLLFATGRSQEHKLELKPQDYEKWSTVSNESIAPHGEWITYKIAYESGKDTVFIQQTLTGKKHAIPSAKDVEFSPDDKYFVYSLPDKSLKIHNLQNDTIRSFENIRRFKFSDKGKYLVIMQETATGNNLILLNRNLERVKNFNNVHNFTLSDDGKLALSLSDCILVCDPKKNFECVLVLSNSNHKFKNLLWSKLGNTLAFLQENNLASMNNNHTIYSYDYTANSLKKLETSNEKLRGLSITSDMQTPIILSDDGKQLFFYTAKSYINTSKDTFVQAWDTATKLVYPAQELYGNPDSISKIAVWYTETGLVNLLATNQLPLSVLTSNRKYVITYSNLTHEPQYDMVADVDYYITDVKSGKRKLLLEKQSTAPYSIGSSTTGRYVHYFKNENWWIYDIATDHHLNVTSKMNIAFKDVDFDEAGSSNGYKCPGWTSKDEFVILYDKYDVWLISPNGKQRQRITKGMESKITFRVCDYLYSTGESQGSADFVQRNFDLSKGLLLSAIGNDKATGYYKWTLNDSVHKIVYGDRKISGLQKAKKSNNYIYLVEDFETPPGIYFTSDNLPSPTKLYQSNVHHSKYNWGKSELLTYKNSKGDELQGALFYPSGFELGKKYPMIVYIYSRLSQNIHQYNNPTMHQYIGFQPTNYTNDGYIVLMPDIKYEVGTPGKSIVDCVVSAVNFVIEKGTIDRQHVGLIGHSYGGYETGYLLTQTSIFAAAVAGSAVNDLLSSYLSLNTETGAKMDWRFESQQYRIGMSPFENLNAYLENSSITGASKINTPLLSWAGKKDMTVDWRQSVELHLALRRLQKKNVFLLYPNQGHILTDKIAQFDLSMRIKNWFGHFLKGLPLIEN